jgi:hypothetical protein
VNANSTVAVVVEGGGEQVVAHVGLHALGSLADRLGLGESLSCRVPAPRLRLHDRGKVLAQTMLMLAGGGEACSDIERLRAQPSLFGAVASDSTLYRTLRSIDAAALEGLWEAMAETRTQVWRRSSATRGNAPVVLSRRVAGRHPFREQGRYRCELQARVRVLAHVLLRRCDRRSARRHVAAGKRDGELDR